ncbi:MAG: hypothetical protein ACI4VG_04525 [Lachnospiraceae bacterium]
MRFINLQQAEYDEFQTRLANLHGELIISENSIRESIRMLSGIEGGFYVQDISFKIQYLLDCITEGPAALLGQVFGDSETAVDAFIQAIIETDTCE